MKLYVFEGSPNARKALAAVYHLGIEQEVEIVRLDVRSGALSTPAFLEMNPNGKVPVLSYGGHSIWESNSILYYLGARFGKGDLVPESPDAHAEMMSWLFWETNHFNRSVGGYVWEKVIKPLAGRGETDKRALAIAKAGFQQAAPVLDTALAGKSFILGEAVSAADFALGAFAAFLKPAAVPVERYRNIVGWLSRLDELPGWRASVPDLENFARV